MTNNQSRYLSSPFVRLDGVHDIYNSVRDSFVSDASLGGQRTQRYSRLKPYIIFIAILFPWHFLVDRSGVCVLYAASVIIKCIHVWCAARNVMIPLRCFLLFIIFMWIKYSHMFRFAAATAAAKYFAQVAQVVLVSGRISVVAYFFFRFHFILARQSINYRRWIPYGCNEFYFAVFTICCYFLREMLMHSSRSLNVRIFSPANTLTYRCYCRSLLVLFDSLSLPISHHTWNTFDAHRICTILPCVALRWLLLRYNYIEFYHFEISLDVERFECE